MSSYSVKSPPNDGILAEQYQGHGIIATASHSAKDILGIKWLVHHKSPSSRRSTTVSATGPTLIYQAHATLKTSAHQTVAGAGSADQFNQHVEWASHRGLYRCHRASVSGTYPLSTTFKQSPSYGQTWLVVVIDCLHGATSYIAQRLFERFCRQLIMLNDTADGSFPLAILIRRNLTASNSYSNTCSVIRADIGIAFDGDGDRFDGCW